MWSCVESTTTVVKSAGCRKASDPSHVSLVLQWSCNIDTRRETKSMLIAAYPTVGTQSNPGLSLVVGNRITAATVQRKVFQLSDGADNDNEYLVASLRL